MNPDSVGRLLAPLVSYSPEDFERILADHAQTKNLTDQQKITLLLESAVFYCHLLSRTLHGITAKDQPVFAERMNQSVTAELFARFDGSLRQAAFAFAMRDKYHQRSDQYRDCSVDISQLFNEDEKTGTVFWRFGINVLNFLDESDPKVLALIISLALLTAREFCERLGDRANGIDDAPLSGIEP